MVWYTEDYTLSRSTASHFTYKHWSLIPKGQTNPLPADAATIPAYARATFHLPPACHPIGGSGASPVRCLSRPSAATPRSSPPNWHRVSDTARQTTSSPPADILQNVVARRQSRQTTFYKLWSLIPKGTTNPLPADAVTIPASARGTFHPPPAAEKRNLR